MVLRCFDEHIIELNDFLNGGVSIAMFDYTYWRAEGYPISSMDNHP